ncbi:phospholipase A2-like [Malaya genurostris]|uniref:phospholipase A2-like n=1 Tax=Malaya genurostris TaxID=325434 RepID=UPI0026F3FA58|nr:phospholipase A2-like [Malaya genurostris]
MHVFILLVFQIVIPLIIATQIDLVAKQSQVFLDHLDHHGNGNVLNEILMEYSYLQSNWTQQNHTPFNDQVIAFLQQHVDVVHKNQTRYKGYAGPGIGIKSLTNFCGPGNWSTNGEVTQNPYFTKIDQCCKSHDECPLYIVQRKDYENFPGLPYKPQLFSRLRCSCDVQFFSCLRDVGTFFSFAVAWIYSKVQTYCIEYEYPVIQCKQQMSDEFIFFARCVDYQVDYSTPKRWQWFNIPYLSANQSCFPNVSY